MRIIQYIKSYLIKKYDKGNRRVLLSLIFSLISSMKNCSIYRIYFDLKSHLWIHKKGENIIRVEDIPNFSISYYKMKFQTINSFFKYYLPEPNDVVIDLGAGIGDDVFIIKHTLGLKGRLYAIEANPNTYEKLQLMTKMNQYTNIVCSNIAIVDNPDKEIFIEDTENNSANKISTKGVGIKIDGRTMDEFVDKHDIKHIDFLKINIEGGEKGALIGMNKSIKMVSNIVIACHDKLAKFYDNDPYFITLDFVKKYLSDHNFTIIDEVESLYHITVFARNNN
jgi:FkbM family methyltransferase